MQRLEKRFGTWGPWLILVVAWLAKTWEMWRHLGSRHYALWGLYFDTVHMDWMSWWTSVALTRPDQDLLYSTFVSYPVGCYTVIDSSLAFVHVVLAGVLRLAVGSPAAHNIVAALGVGVSLLGVFLLLRHISRSGVVAALLSALVVTYGIAWVRTLPDLELVFFGYLAFALLAWYRYVEVGGKWRLALAVFLVGLTSFSQMYYGFSLLGILAAIAVLAAVGLPLRGVTRKALLHRTLWVLGLGILASFAFHARNIGNVVSVVQLPVNDHPIAYEIWEGALLIGVVLFALVLGFLAAVPSALFWGLAVLPLAILSLGERLHSASLGMTLDMPLHWVRAIRPFLWRLSFGFRFIAPTLLGLAALYAALWAERGRILARLPQVKERVAALVLVVLFWLTAAYAPLYPRFERMPLLAGSIDAEACTAPQPDVCTMVQRWANQCDEPPLSSVDAAPPPTTLSELGRALGPLFEPFVPVATVPMPEIPPCVKRLAEEPGEFAILELSRYPQNAYRAYFQTIHGKPLSGFPVRDNDSQLRVEVMAPNAHAQEGFLRGTLRQLPDAADLARGNVKYVMLHQKGRLPRCLLRVPQRGERGSGAPTSAAAPMPVQPGDDVPVGHPLRPRDYPREDFVAAYGEPVCEDGAVVLFATAPGGTP